MERKIGEIFEYNGEWYQCVESDSCGECSLFTTECGSGTKSDLADKVFGQCSKVRRTDNKHVIFKKLEKVGEPHFIKDEIFEGGKVYVQNFKVYEDFEGHKPICNDYIIYDWKNRIISIEIKQTKEDMEEKKLIELLSEKVHNAWMKEKEAQGFSYGKDYDKEKKKHPDMLPYNELKEEVKEYDRATVRAVLQAQKELQSKYNYNNLKSFDIEAAKAGKPVCTRNGHKARIICFDAKSSKPVIALITRKSDDYEEGYSFYEDGRACGDKNNDYDLMMLPEKKEGWVNVYKGGLLDTKSYPTKKEAFDKASPKGYVDTIKINWSE